MDPTSHYVSNDTTNPPPPSISSLIADNAWYIAVGVVAAIVSWMRNTTNGVSTPAKIFYAIGSLAFGPISLFFAFLEYMVEDFAKDAYNNMSASDKANLDKFMREAKTWNAMEHIEKWLVDVGFSLHPHREILMNVPTKYKAYDMTPELLIEAMAYLEADHVPLVFMDYVKDVVPSKYQKSTVVRHLLKMQEHMRNDAWKKSIVEGDFPLSRFIVERKYTGKELEKMRDISKEYVKNNMNAALLANLVIRRDVRVLEKLVQHGCPVDGMAYYNACSFGVLDIVKYLDRINAPRHPESLVQAAFKGHLDIVKYLIQTGCPYDHHASIGAARNGYLHVLKYFHDHLEKTLFDELLYNAASRNHVHVAKYLVFKGCSANEEAMRELATSGGCIEMMAFLKENKKMA